MNENCLGNLEPGKPLSDVRGQHGRIHCRPGPKGHVRYRDFAPTRGGSSDDGALEYVWMAIQSLLDLDEGDVSTPRDDDVSAPVADLGPGRGAV